MFEFTLRLQSDVMDVYTKLYNKIRFAICINECQFSMIEVNYDCSKSQALVGKGTDLVMLM